MERPMADDNEKDSIWGDDRLESASEDELVEHIKDLQQLMQRIADDVDENRELLYFVFDVLAGQTNEYMPEDLEPENDE